MCEDDLDGSWQQVEQVCPSSESRSRQADKFGYIRVREHWIKENADVRMALGLCLLLRAVPRSVALVCHAGLVMGVVRSLLINLGHICFTPNSVYYMK